MRSSNFSFLILFGIAWFFMSCQKLKPETVNISEYPDFEKLMEFQIEQLAGSKIKKQVSLDGKQEEQILELDSANWVKELSFMKEINPNQAEYIGAFEQSQASNLNTLTLKPEENGLLKSVRYEQLKNQFNWIEVTFHEDKDIYVHHRDIRLSFKEGILRSLQIDGYQYMMYGDTVRFSISTALFE